MLACLLHHLHSLCPRYVCGAALSMTKKTAKKGAASVTSGNSQASPSNSFAALADQEEDVCSTSRPTSGSPETKSQKLGDPLVWIDLEMTGLDIEQHTIIEIACIVTDGNLKIRVEGPSLVIHQPEELLAVMNDWSKEQHGASGLTQRVRDSQVSLREAEAAVLGFVQQHVPDAGVALLAGNSIHVDRMFLLKFMPELTAHLSYRIVDVSSIRELSKRWYPNAYRKAPRKLNAHTALSDIRESIQELSYYRKAIFRSGGKD